MDETCKIEAEKNKNHKERDTNLDLLRIVAMIMIIILHFNNFGNVINNYDLHTNSIGYYIFNGLEYACIIAVNLYVFITGYYMIKSKIKLNKIIKLWGEIFFYSFGIYVILLITGKVRMNPKDLIQTMFPVLTSRYWFMTAYIALYLLIPFINMIANKLEKKNYQRLLLINFLLFTILPILPDNSGFKIAGGYSVVFFIVLYLTAGYIRLYFNKKIKSSKLLILYIGLIVLQVIAKKILHRKGLFFCNYNSPVIYIETIIVFLLFKNIEIKNNILNKVITKISPLVLAVYLIHGNYLLGPILWNEILNPSRFILTKNIYMMLGLTVIVIFIFSIIIEKIRQILFNSIVNKNKENNTIEEKLLIIEEKLYDKF